MDMNGGPEGNGLDVFATASHVAGSDAMNDSVNTKPDPSHPYPLASSTAF